MYYKPKDLARKLSKSGDTGTPGTVFFPRPRRLHPRPRPCPRPRPRHFGKCRGIPARPRRGPRPRATLV